MLKAPEIAPAGRAWPGCWQRQPQGSPRSHPTTPHCSPQVWVPEETSRERRHTVTRRSGVSSLGDTMLCSRKGSRAAPGHGACRALHRGVIGCGEAAAGPAPVMAKSWEESASSAASPPVPGTGSSPQRGQRPWDSGLVQRWRSAGAGRTNRRGHGLTMAKPGGDVGGGRRRAGSQAWGQTPQVLGFPGSQHRPPPNSTQGLAFQRAVPSENSVAMLLL